MKGARIKGIYGKPWSRMAQEPIPIDRRVLERLGQKLVEAVVAEAQKDLSQEARAVAVSGKPVGLPNSKAFLDSFGYQISGESTVELTCSWPRITQYLEGRAPFKMAWLTQANGVDVVPIQKKPNVVLFRAAPLNLANAWVHPGFARHTFLQRGIRKGREEMMRVLAQEAVQYVMKGNPFR